MNELLRTVREEFPRKKILIVGDLVADQFLHGTIARVSREAPVFILRHDGTDTYGGGAANAAVNVASLGAKPTAVGLIGRDANGELLLDTMRRSGVNCDFAVAGDELQTTTKVRVLAGHHYAARQQVIRVDYENTATVSSELRRKQLANLEKAFENVDAAIFADYGYGAADNAVFDHAKTIADGMKIPIFVDSRFRLTEYSGAFAATPNQDEVEQILGKRFTQADCDNLRSRLNLKALLMTRGNKGMRLFELGKPPVDIEAVGSKEPVDVTGAGDTVIAAFALGVAAGLGFREAASVANHAGGIVVMKKGTARVTNEELVRSLEEHSVRAASEPVG